MNLQQLEHFLVLVETRSFSRAAEMLHLTQPALSRSIQALEDALGGRLLERGKNKTLTPLGELAVARAGRIRVELAELKRSAEMLAGYESGSIRLSLGPTPAAILSVPLYREMMKRYPAIKLQLSGGTPEMQLQELRRGSIDALVVHRNHIPAEPDLCLNSFSPMPLAFVVRSGHPLATKRRLEFEDLKTYPVAASGRAMSGEILHRLNEHFGAGGHFVDVIRYQSNDMTSLVETVRTSNAAFFGVLSVAQPWIDRGELTQLTLRPSLTLTSQFAFVTLEGKTLPPALARIRELCEMYMAGNQAPATRPVKI